LPSSPSASSSPFFFGSASALGARFSTYTFGQSIRDSSWAEGRAGIFAASYCLRVCRVWPIRLVLKNYYSCANWSTNIFEFQLTFFIILD
jgi:hypothetical protein